MLETKTISRASRPPKFHPSSSRFNLDTNIKNDNNSNNDNTNNNDNNNNNNNNNDDDNNNNNNNNSKSDLSHLG